MYTMADEVFDGSLLREILWYSDRNEAFMHTHVSKKYMISTHGRLLRVGSERFRKPYVSKAGYHSYGMNDMRQFSQHAHRLVAHAFLPNPLQHPTVDHIDGNPRNNLLANLRWASHADQARNKKGYTAKSLQLGLYRDDVLIGTYASRNEFEKAHELSLKNVATSLNGHKFLDGELVGHILRATTSFNEPAEEWRDLVYPEEVLRDGYMVSNMGRVKLIRRKTYGFDTSDGYKSVALQRSGSSKFTCALVHRLIAYAFLGVPDNASMLVVNHRNGDKSDNSVANLEWATYSDNTIHSSNVLNTHLLRAVASYDQFYGNLIKVYSSIKQAADDIGKTSSSVQHAVKHGGLIADMFWRYVDETAPPTIDLATTKKTNMQRVGQYDQVSGELISVYKSFTEASTQTGFSKEGLMTAASKKKSSCGFIWIKIPFGDVPRSIDPSAFRIAGKYTRRHIKGN